jgi:excisionase family DNA binding protein
MPYKLNKIIFQRDNIKDYETHIHPLDTEIDFPFVAGQFKELVPKEHQYSKKSRLELSTSPLFNESGLTKLIPEVGPKGIYYLELRPGHKLKQLVVELDDVYVDIYIGPKDTLIYSFYNPTQRNSISIMAAIEKDNENIWQKIYAHPNDLYWRQLFINDAKRGNFLSAQIPPPVKELMNQDQLADYLQVTKKTVQNWTTNRTIPFEKIPGTREVRYRKSDIDTRLKSTDNSQRKKKK